MLLYSNIWYADCKKTETLLVASHNGFERSNKPEENGVTVE